MERKVRERVSSTDYDLDTLMVGDVYPVTNGDINFRTLVYSPKYGATHYQLFMIGGVLSYQDDYGMHKFDKATHAYNIWINRIIMSE